MSQGSSLVSGPPSYSRARSASATGVQGADAFEAHDAIARRRRERRSTPQFEKVGPVASRYAKYLALFVGAGLISGSVVHLAPGRYSVIGAIGATLFALASVLTERSERGSGDLVRVAISALALALGIGMISGSRQHFQDIPDRAAALIPIGIVLSLGAFVVRHGIRVRGDQLAACFAVVVAFAVVLFIGLNHLAGRVDVAAADHHGATTSKPAVSLTAKDDAAPKKSVAPTGGPAASEKKHAADGHGH